MTDTTQVRPDEDQIPCAECKSTDHTTKGHIDGGTPVVANGHIDGGAPPKG